MVKGFENITEELTEFEIGLIPEVVDILLSANGREKAVSNKNICEIVNGQGNTKKLHGIKLRKIIHHIRYKGLVNRLCSNSNGYFIGTEKDCIDYIQSLKDRIGAIDQIKLAIELQLKTTPICNGKCGMNYCDDNGCIERKRILLEPVVSGSTVYFNGLSN